MSEVTVWYLQTLAPEELVAATAPSVEATLLAEAEIKQYPFNRFLYQLVGGPWGWTDKLQWSEKQWQDYAEAEDLRTWVLWQQGSPAGYFELQKRADTSVEICYFGLAEKFIGKGLGGWLLSESIRQAWQWGAQRVEVNTCSLDHPSALANYQARGMNIFRTESRPA
jgi:GNAT superfamily N-acetyltransferase